MTPEERQIITGYVERVAGAAQPPASIGQSTGPWGARSVPSTQPNLPPVDQEADRLIADLFARYPEARYRITQTAFVQEAALVQAQNRIQELEWQLENAQNQMQANQNRGGFLGGMFGGSNRPVQQTPPPQPIPYPQGMNPQAMQQGGGGGFLRTAAMTAAGVAGGMVLGNVLMNAFSGHGGAAQAASNTANAGTGSFGEQAVNTPSSSPWTNPGGQDASPVADQSGGWGGQDAQPVSDNSGNWGNDDAAAYDDASGFDDEL